MPEALRDGVAQTCTQQIVTVAESVLRLILVRLFRTRYHRIVSICGYLCGQCSSHVASTTVLSTLNECRFVLQDVQCILQSVDLGLASPLALLVSLRLGDAFSTELAIVLVHCVQLSLCRAAVAGEL